MVAVRTSNDSGVDPRVPVGAMGFMLIAVFGYSLTPVVVAFASDVSPFLFNAAWRLGLVLGLSVVIAWRRAVFSTPGVRGVVLRRLRSPAIVAAVVSNFDYALFVLSTMVIDISVATVIFETWPMWMILTLAWIYRKEERYRRNVVLTVLMVGLCLVGLCLVTISQSEDALGFVTGQAPGRLLLGSALALAGALAGSLAAHSFRWGTELAGELAAILRSHGSPLSYRSLDLFCLVLAYAVSSSVSVLASLIIGTVGLGPVNPGAVVLSVVGGLAAYAPATVAWRMGNLRSGNLGVNAMVYGTPVLSLGWFYLLSRGWMSSPVRLDVFNIASVEYLLVGVAVIVVANLVVNLEAEVRWILRGGRGRLSAWIGGWRSPATGGPGSSPGG